MKTVKELKNLEERELIHEILVLQETIKNLKHTECHASQIHNYHFASNEILKLTEKRYLGSGFIMSISSLKGEPIVKPVTISDGFSNSTINCLLDELQKTFDYRVSFKPTEERL